MKWVAAAVFLMGAMAMYTANSIEKAQKVSACYNDHCVTYPE